MLRLVIASATASAKVNPADSPSVARAQVLMQDVARQFAAQRLAFASDPEAIELLGIPLTSEETIHVNTLLWKFAGLAPVALKDPPPAPTAAPAGALPPLEDLSNATAMPAIPIPAIPVFQQRVIYEWQALQDRLKSQLAIMDEYVSILCERIQGFGTTAAPLTVPPPEGAPLIKEVPPTPVPILPETEAVPTPVPSDPHDAPRSIATPDRDASVGMGEKTPPPPQGEPLDLSQGGEFFIPKTPEEKAGQTAALESEAEANMAALPTPGTVPIPPEGTQSIAAPATAAAPETAAAAPEASSSSSAPSSQPAV